MNPNYTEAATKAIETVSFFGDDPLEILNKLHNVLVISYSFSSMDGELLIDESTDAISMVNRKNGKLQYIILYNSNLSPAQVRLALARELGHVMLEHDGNGDEFVWIEEANCFAHHFLCPMVKPKKIQYRSKQKTLLWELKTVQPFDSVESIKAYVADKKNRYNRIVREDRPQYTADDVKLCNQKDFDNITGWRNCYDVILDGETVGYCGE